MKILLIHQYYKTPDEGGGIRSYYIAEYFSRLGHEVTVITAYNEKDIKVRKVGEVKVYYLPVYYTNHLSFWSRIHAFYRFVTMAKKLLKKVQPVDLNYVITTPLSTGLIALYAKRKFKTPYIFEVGDLWPDAPVQLGVLKNRILKRMAYHLERKSYMKAKKIIALSPDIKSAIEKKSNRGDIDVITNMADTDWFSFEDKKPDLVAKYQVESKFVVTYAGTVGIANHLEYMVEAAKKCAHRPEVHFIIVGSGACWNQIMKYAQVSGVDNIDFIDFVDKGKVREIMNVTDAVYVSFKNKPVLATGSPNKFFDGLAAGKLIIINFRGWIKDMIEKEECGFYHHPENPDSFYSKLDLYLKDDKKLKAAKQKSRQLALTYFNKTEQLQQLAHYLKIENED